MKVVVTGASGNVGTAVLRAAAATGWEVVAIARRPPDPGYPPYSGARWIGCDIGGPAAAPVLAAAFEGAQAVVHLAWAVNPRRDDPPARRTNRVGTDNVLRAAAHAGVGHLTVASSVAAYTPTRRWQRVTEDQARTGVAGSAYSAGKAELEARLDMFAGQRPEIGVARIRPCGIAQGDAAAEFRDWLLPQWFPHRMIARRWLPLWHGLRLQLVHADDVAAAIERIVTRRAVGAFDLAAEPVLPAPLLATLFGGFRVPVARAALSTAAGLSWRAGVQPLHPGWLRLADQACLVRAERARRELDWRPSHSAIDTATELADGLRAGRRWHSPVLDPRPLSLRPGRPTHQDQTPREPGIGVTEDYRPGSA